MRARGFTLVEALVVVAIVLVMAATAAPAFRALFADAHVLGAGRQFKSQFRLACSAAVRSGVYTAIRFERREHGTVWYAVYQDGDQDGVRSPDIADGKDTLLSGPFPLSGGAPGVTVGINPGVPALPPEARPLSGDPARFGSSTSSPSRPSKRRRGNVLPGRRRLAGRRPRHRRQPTRPPHGVAGRGLAGEVITQLSCGSPDREVTRLASTRSRRPRIAQVLYRDRHTRCELEHRYDSPSAEHTL